MNNLQEHGILIFFISLLKIARLFSFLTSAGMLFQYSIRYNHSDITDIWYNKGEGTIWGYPYKDNFERESIVANFKKKLISKPTWNSILMHNAPNFLQMLFYLVEGQRLVWLLGQCKCKVGTRYIKHPSSDCIPLYLCRHYHRLCNSTKHADHSCTRIGRNKYPLFPLRFC